MSQLFSESTTLFTTPRFLRFGLGVRPAVDFRCFAAELDLVREPEVYLALLAEDFLLLALSLLFLSRDFLFSFSFRRLRSRDDDDDDVLELDDEGARLLVDLLDVRGGGDRVLSRGPPLQASVA